MDSLYVQLGGEETIDKIVEQLYRNVLNDSDLAPFFNGINVPLQQRKFLLFLNLATDGPHHYSGLELRSAHANVVEEGASEMHVDKLLHHLKSALEQVDADSDLIEAVIHRVKCYTGDVLGH